MFDLHTIGEINETYECCNFNCRNQQPNEPIDAYIAALRTLAKTCQNNFCDCLKDSLLKVESSSQSKDSQLESDYCKTENFL